MNGLLDTWPVDWSDRRLQELRATLAKAMYREREIVDVLEAVGLEPSEVALDQSARLVWADAIRLASRMRMLPALVNEVGRRLPGVRVRVDELLGAEPVFAKTVPPASTDALAPADPRWKNFSGDQRERKIVEGDKTLLDISFLELGLTKAAAVCKLTVSMASGIYWGTAFRIGPSVLLTNHHVLYDWDRDEAPSLSVEASFGYELDMGGRLRKATVVSCDVSTIAGERAHDFALIAAEALPDDVPILSLTAATGIEVNDRVVIVQHPEGLPKKIALAHNLVRYVDADVVQYWTDTDNGSSGSPVFDENWDVVALHHFWVQSPTDDGTAYRNQGRNIRRIAERMAALGVDLGGA